MNLQSIAAFLIAGFVLAAVVLSTGDTRRFLDAHAILVVVGGTLAASAISLQVDRIAMMFRIFLRNVLGLQKINFVALIDEMKAMAEVHRLGASGLKELVGRSRDPFLREAMTLVMENVMDRERLVRILQERVNTIYERECEEVLQFRIIGRYPPAFGLVGTTLSMITLLGRLGEPEGQKEIGPAMAIGLVATFYGLILSNLVFHPISENLAQSTRRKQTKNTIIVEGVNLIMQKTNPVILAEELNSFLLPSERSDFADQASKSSSWAA